MRGPLIGSAQAIIDRELRALGPMRRGEIDTLVVFALTAVLWVFRRDLDVQLFRIPGWSGLLADQRIDGRRRFKGELAGTDGSEILINVDEGTIGLGRAEEPGGSLSIHYKALD